MKSRSSLIIAVFVFVLFAVAVFLRKLRRVKIHNMRSFSFVYTCKSDALAERCYKLSIKDGEYTASFKDAGIPNSEAKIKTVSKEFALRLEGILNRYRITKWDRFDKTKLHVSDGNSFSLEIYDENGSSVSARGYEKTPRKFEAVKKDIEALFSEVFEENATVDVK